MIGFAWLLVTVGLLAWPARHLPDQEPRRIPRPRKPEREQRRDGLLAPAAGVGVSVVMVALGGVPTGVLAAVVVGPGVALAVEWLRLRPSRPAPDRSLALCLDLVAAVLRGGRPLAVALETAAPAAGPDAAAGLIRVARLLQLGADARQAWQSVAPPRSLLEPVAAVAIRSQVSGIRLADAFERLAADLRAECSATAAVRANRAGVHAMGPLAACFLPSFVCLGIVPVIVGVAVTATRTLQ